MAEQQTLSKLGSIAVQQIGLAWGVNTELTKLKDNISAITNILLDAEEQQIKDSALREWLRRLKHVIYNADDLFDDVTYEALRRQVETHKSTVRVVRNFFTGSNSILFHYVVGRKIKGKIKDIRESLDEIASEMRDFQFVVKHVERPIEIKRREETSSHEVIGRESDRDCLINMLLSSENEENIRIIPIVGMGGLGKTTLAQVLYKDDRIQQHFSKKMWVFVSDDFDIKTILIKLLQETNDNSYTNQGIEQVKNHAQEVLQDNKFFLVLDDVWNEDPVKWTELEALLIMGARGSRIVVTTRSKCVASVVCTRTMEPYELKGVSNKQCLDILLNWAFKKGEESKHQNLVDIGKEIVKKCEGVPLAAKTLGTLLFSNTNVHYWSSIKNNEMWALVKGNDIFPILKLSYDQMSSRLKKCFGYCSLFEKHEHFSKHQLIYGWMAHGFLQSSDEKEELEDIGEVYILELVRRSFLQPIGFLHFYTMHGLVHDLAHYVAGNDYMTITEADIEIIPDGPRHVSFDFSTYLKFPISFANAKKLRTMFLPRKRKTQRKFRSCIELELSSLKCLRVLKAHSLPKNVGALKRLRFLSFTTEQELPNSLCKLLNLQYLNLGGSLLSELPRDFGNLVNLRTLFLSSKLTCLPKKGISGLSSLQTLILEDNNELRSLGEGIQYLTSLQNLVISKCENLEFCDNDFQRLRSLKALTLLKLPWLEVLPKGLQDAAATLTHLEIQLCSNMTIASETVLSKLQSLQSLRIDYCRNIRSLPEGMQCLTMLHSLSINGCPDLTRRCEQGVGEDWPKIAHISQIQIDAQIDDEVYSKDRYFEYSGQKQFPSFGRFRQCVFAATTCFV